MTPRSISSASSSEATSAPDARLNLGKTPLEHRESPARVLHERKFLLRDGARRRLNPAGTLGLPDRSSLHEELPIRDDLVRPNAGGKERTQSVIVRLIVERHLDFAVFVSRRSLPAAIAELVGDAAIGQRRAVIVFQ